MTWPGEEHGSGRPCRRSPLYDTLKKKGAVFGEKLGWERPNWFAQGDEVARDIYTFERPNWHDFVGREHRCARKAAVLIDQTSFAKFILKGPDAEAALNWIAANRTDRPVGSITYTQMLNDRGGIECDLTLTRTAQDTYYIVTGTGFATRDFNWILRNIPKNMNAQLFDVTSSNAVLSLFGPNARFILQACTRDDVSATAIAFGQSQTIGISGCPVLAMRITYVGELGWDLRNAGYRAIETLRLEKAYRAWGSDIGPDHTPVEAGLDWAVKSNTDIKFKGRDAILAQQKNGVKKSMATFICDENVVLHGRETLFRNGKRCGWLSSAGYGHTIQKSIGMGYVRSNLPINKAFVLAGEYELEVATRRIPI